MLRHLEAKSSIESEDFWMASLEEKADDSSTLENSVPRRIGQMYFVLRRRRLEASIRPLALFMHNMGH